MNQNVCTFAVKKALLQSFFVFSQVLLEDWDRDALRGQILGQA